MKIIKLLNWWLLIVVTTIYCHLEEDYTKPDPTLNDQPMKILTSLTFGTRSHIKGIMEIGKQLQSRGHEINYMALEPYLKFSDGYSNLTKYQIGPTGFIVDDHRGNSELNDKMVDPMIDTVKALIDHLPTIYDLTFQDIMEVIQVVKPDVMICDFFSPSCIDAGLITNIPVITGFQTLDGPMTPPPYITSQLSYYPTTIDNLNFLSRFYSTIIHPITILPGFMRLNHDLNLVRLKYGIPLTSFTDLGNWSKTLKLCNTFTGFESARPWEPTTKLIGPIMSDTFPPLTDELKEFLNNRERVIYIAFGSGVILAKKDIEIILTAVKKLMEDGSVDGILWALGKTSPTNFHHTQLEFPSDNQNFTTAEILNNQHPNLKFLTWAPQVAILNHRSIKIFLSHGGLESTFESIHSGTPLLTMPFYGDQFRNSRKLMEMGVGNYTDRFTHTHQSLHLTLNIMLIEKHHELKNNLMKWQIITRMNDRRKDEAADLIEELILIAKTCRPHHPTTSTYPCELHHLLPLYYHLPFYQTYAIDVYSITLLLIILTISLSILGFYKFILIITTTTTTKTTLTTKFKLKDQ